VQYAEFQSSTQVVNMFGGKLMFTFTKPLSGVVVIAVAILLSGCAFTNTAVSAEAPNTSNNYPTEVRANFVAACEAQPGATTAVCNGCLEAVENAFSYDKFVEIDTAIRMGTSSREDSDKLASVLADCA
jgi:hypothetical protein